MTGIDKLEQRHIRAYNAALATCGHRNDVTAIDIGYRWEANRPTDEIAIRLHVRRKRLPEALGPGERLPRSILGVPVDVYEGSYRTQRDTRGRRPVRRFDPMMAGIPVGSARGGAGRIGAFVADRATGRIGLLSNWHVLVGPYGQAGDGCVQPGAIHGGVGPRDRVAQVGPSLLDRDGDAAVAWLTGERGWRPHIHGAEVVPVAARRARLGEVLRKSCPASGPCMARVDGIGTYFLQYETAPGKTRRIGVEGFKLIALDPADAGTEVSVSGDSGTLWYDASARAAVGLHFGGEVSPDPRQQHAIACHVETVLERLDVRLAGRSDMKVAKIARTHRHGWLEALAEAIQGDLGDLGEPACTPDRTRNQGSAELPPPLPNRPGHAPHAPVRPLRLH